MKAARASITLLKIITTNKMGYCDGYLETYGPEARLALLDQMRAHSQMERIK
jgi:hypothetical protein